MRTLPLAYSVTWSFQVAKEITEVCVCAWAHACMRRTACLCSHTPVDEGAHLSGWCRWSLQPSSPTPARLARSPDCTSESEDGGRDCMVRTEGDVRKTDERKVWSETGEYGGFPTLAPVWAPETSRLRSTTDWFISTRICTLSNSLSYIHIKWFQLLCIFFFFVCLITQNEAICHVIYNY